ncbi:unnamed protein product [Spirodela intermedia]|uniref:protein-serine/threonine phosphatase n=1 Tax=Spirodela intermedia TaxID=51605 RepID=A0A7I8IMY4_SPIIN|nr:unnamed protein product [Spirodela intermedia]CAA6658507.1 unnamed protein product [Spirodela intermedia]
MTVRLILLLLLWSAISGSYAAETSTCLTVYKEGGAPAVFRSPRCPRWTLFHEEDHGGVAAMHQGRRRSQEDRAVCAFNVRIPSIGKNLLRKEVSVGIVAVFDGHNGAEASEMASQLFLDYFYLHVYFLLNGAYSSIFRKSTEKFENKRVGDVVLHGVRLDEGPGQDNAYPGRSSWIYPKSYDGNFYASILHLVQEASRKSLESGSTATIVLIVEGEILVANVGDSKAVMCSESRHHPELTKDHHPDRDGERKRVEAAGGFVQDWAGVPRVNGELAVSRAIGDVPYKRYGVISTPEVTDWLPLYNNDSYLVVASDGIFEKLTVQEVCDLLWEASFRENINLELISTMKHVLADLLVKAAFERGSMDNMAAIVIPLASNISSPRRDEDEYDSKECADSARVSMGKYMKDTITSTSLISMEYFNQIETKFKKLLVKADYRRDGCFYLAEDLNENSDYVFRAPKDHRNDEHNEIIQSSPEGLNYDSSAWPLNLYNGQNFCWDIDMGSENAEGLCVNPEGFVNFLGLLSSIPLNDSGSNSSESFNDMNAGFRYTLKRKFDRGSYGEVWLAFHWNCSEESPGVNNFRPNVPDASSPLNSSEGKSSSDTNSSTRHNFFESVDNDYFILKRIMVERGNAAYLSGLREKYYGEIFANASKSQDRSQEESGSTTVFFTDFQYESSSLQGMNDLVPHDTQGSSCSGFQRMVYEEGLNHIARFIESFTSQSKEIWLVFRHEGLSLSKLLYTVDEKKLFNNNDGDRISSNVQVLRPSVWWHWLRTTEAGKREMQNLIRQLLLALKSCHRRNITHRDIKPENMIICFEEVGTGRCSRAVPTGENQHHLKMRIIDFGSAIDDFTLKNLYGSGPPVHAPEALLNISWFKGPRRTTMKYDMWSISDRTHAMVDQHLEGWGDNMKELAYKLRSLMEMCILIPGLSTQYLPGGGKDREERLSVDDALQHPYFKSDL